ncbi:YceI family protein [Singulisphaera rosea]
MMLRKFFLAMGLVSGLALGSGSVPTASGQTFTVDAVHSSVIFRVKHANTSYAYGRFNEISGQFAIVDQNPAQSHFDFQVKTASIDTGNAKRDEHLKSPDFFNAVQFPTIAFKSTSVTKTAPETYQVAGDLSLHGVTRPIKLSLKRTGTGKDMKGKAIAGLEASFFAIKRSEFKMANMVGPIGDDVWVTVSVEGGE